MVQYKVIWYRRRQYRWSIWESEALLVQVLIENYFIAITALISNSGCINYGVQIAAFQFSSLCFIQMCIA